MTTIRDIAKITGYSVSTISRVINEFPYVDEEKRQKVLAIMDELNYVPNRLAQNLSHGETKHVGVVIPFLNASYYNQLLKGIMSEAFKYTYKVTLLPTNHDPELEMNYLKEFAQKSFDGLIISSRSNPTKVFKEYLKYGPIVFCEDIAELPVATSYIDLEASLSETMLYLKDLGMKKIGLTLGRSHDISRNSRLAVKLAHEIFPTFDENNIFWDCCDAEDGIQAAAFFEKHPVEAIVVNGDDVAANILLHHKGKKPIVVGRENLLVSEVLQFSTVDHHLKECGETAFRLFHTGSIQQIRHPHTFIKR